MLVVIKLRYIVYVDHYAGGPKYGMEFRPYYLAREWVRAGHRVAMLAASFSHVRSVQPTPPDGVIVVKHGSLLVVNEQGSGAMQAALPGIAANIDLTGLLKLLDGLPAPPQPAPC